MTYDLHGNLPTQQVKVDDKTVYIKVSPCSWLNKGYGLQIGLSLRENAANIGTVFDVDRSVDATTVAKQDLLPLALTQAQRWVGENGLDRLQTAFKNEADLYKKWDEMERQRLINDMRRYTKAKNDGYTHVMTASIHPKSGNDKIVEVLSVGAPDAETIKRTLRYSVVKNDYRVALISDVIAKLRESIDPQPEEQVKDRMPAPSC